MLSRRHYEALIAQTGKVQIPMMNVSLRLYRLLLLLFLLDDIKLIWDYLLEECLFVLIRHLHVENLFSFFIFSSQSEHLKIIFDYALRQHAVAQVSELVLNRAHSVFIVSKYFFLFCIAEEEFWVLTTGSFLEEERIEFEEAASLLFDEHPLCLVLLTINFHLLLSIKESPDSAGSLRSLPVILSLPI